jgi:hypothetical protein
MGRLGIVSIAVIPATMSNISLHEMNPVTQGQASGCAWAVWEQVITTKMYSTSDLMCNIDLRHVLNLEMVDVFPCSWTGTTEREWGFINRMHQCGLYLLVL